MMEKLLHGSYLIKKDKKEVYKGDKWSLNIDRFEGITKVEQTKEGSVRIPLLDHKKIGLIQIGVYSLFRRGTDTLILACVLYCRHLNLNLKDALIGGIHFNLYNKPIIFNVYPDYHVSLEDRNLHKSLTI